MNIKVGFLGLLFLLFLGLKLGGAIDWSWWWIFSPIWIIPVLCLAALVCFVVTAIILGDKYELVKKK